MSRRVLGAALAAASLALVAAVSAGGAGAQTTLPDCAPGTPVPAPPIATVTGDPGSESRLVAGRPITVEYDDPALLVSVQTTIGPPGTTFDGGADGPGVTMTLPAAGAFPITAKYYLTRDGTCVHDFTYIVQVEPGKLVPAGIGVGQGRIARGGVELTKLPRRGVLIDQFPVAGVDYGCDALQAVVPITAILREERDLRRRPSESSPALRLDIPDPCGSKAQIASLPGVALRFVTGGDPPDDGTRMIAAETHTKKPRRYWLQIVQGTRPLGSLRYYTAFRPQRGRFAATRIMAPEAAFESARCKRPPSDQPLGFRTWPFPPCVRR